MKAPLFGWPQTMRKVRQSPSTHLYRKVAQGFNIFINALLRMLTGTITGQNEDISHGLQNEDISHGLQIGKDQKGDNQRDENGCQFNNIGFIDDFSIFADAPEGIQKLLKDVQEFTVVRPGVECKSM